MHALALTLALASFSPAQDVFPRPEPLAVLVVSGASNHDWAFTSAELARLLEESGRFRVEITTDPARRFLEDDLGQRYDALVIDYNGPRWGGEAEAAFLVAVHEGLGVVLVHAANNAFPGWIEYEELVGLCWREGAGHGSFHPFAVEFLDRAHPLSRTLPAFVAHPDELYHRLKRMHESKPRVLGSAFSSRESGGTGEVEPVLTVNRWGAGRIAYTTLGHVWPDAPETRASYADPQLRELLVRMTEWVATGEVDDGSRLPPRPHELEVALGWRALVDDGRPLAWRGSEFDGFPPRGWGEQAGALRLRARTQAGDLVTHERFADFELELEWQVALGGSSRLGYRTDGGDSAGLELSLLDDARQEEGLDPRAATGALWGLFAPQEAPAARPLRFRNARVVAAGNSLEHWLDGRRVLAVQVGSPEWSAAREASVYAGRALFGTRTAGRIVLQDRGSELWVRAMRVRDLGAPPGRALALFDGETLAGWEARGEARWAVEERALSGRGAGLLLHERELGDFTLVADLLARGAGELDLLLRAELDLEGRASGARIRLASADPRRAGTLREEDGRGDPTTLAAKPQAQAAFVPDDWNRVRIECVGPWLRVWINGIPTWDRFEAGPVAGRVGLLLAEAAGDALVDLVELRELGARRARSLLDPAGAAPPVGTPLEPVPRADLCLRVLFEQGQSGPPWRLLFRSDPRASGEVSRRRAPGLASHERAWVLEPADLGLTPGRHELQLAAYGRRIALHADGRLVAEIRGAWGPGAGALVLERTGAADEPLGIERLELLEAAD